MKGMLLSEEHFRSLLNAESFKEVLHILQTTNYAEEFSDIPAQDISPSELSNILYKSLFQDYEKTIRSIHSRLRGFFILLYQKYELINLKTILRGIFSHTEPEKVALLLLPTERYTLFSKETLLEFRNVQDVISHLQGTFFQYPLNRALRRFEDEQEFFPLEMALDLHYYHTLWETMEKLPEAEKKIVTEILGMSLDMLNVAWIIRFKEEYHFSTEEILNYTIQHGYAFAFRERRELAETRDTEEIIASLKNTPYGKGLADNVSPSNIYVNLCRYMIDQLKKFFAGNPFQIGVILGYLWLKEFEIADIITIAEAKKYGFSLEQSQHYVIHLKSA